MASTTVGENQLQRIIRDLHDAVAELSKEHRESGEPITDDSSSLHKFSYKLEYLLQFDQKEKTTFLGARKDYWEYFCECLAKIKGANDGIRFVKSIPELKTSLGKGRGFIRYSLVHQRLADTLQQCIINQRVTSDWYYARSPFLKSHLNFDIINHLYELNEVQFDVASRGHDLDSEWPTFARRALGSALSSAHLWRPPSRCSSINSLVSSYSQQVQEFLPGPDFNPSLLGELGELGGLSSCSAADDLRIELDQSELRQQELLKRVRQLSEEAVQLQGVIKDLQGQLLASKSASQERHKEEGKGDHPASPGRSQEADKANGEWAEHLQAAAQEMEALQVRRASERHLEAKLSIAENKNMELLAKLDGALSEKGQQAANYCDSAWKIQELLAKLKEVEGERLEAQRESEDRARQAERLAQELRAQEESGKESERKLAALRESAAEERAAALRQADELQAAMNRLQGALSLRERESGNLRTQLRDLQGSLEARERQAEELKRREQEEREELQQRSSGLREALDGQLLSLREQLRAKEADLSVSTQRIQQLEQQRESQGSEVSAKEQARKVEDYKAQCTSLMELNGKLLQTVKRNEESIREMALARAATEKDLATLRASERQLKGRVDSAGLSAEERERSLREENQRLEESVQRALLKSEAKEPELRRLERENQDLRRLERENQELREGRVAVSEQLLSTQEKLGSVAAQAAELEKKSLSASRENQAERRGGQPQGADTQLVDGELQTGAARLEPRTKKPGREKGAPVAREAASTLAVAEAQLELNVREVYRLQAEVTDLRVQLLASAEEQMKTQALQEVTEASREDLRAQTEQLKAQVEELNRRHVEELLHGREREEALGRERDGEARARVALAAEVTAAREDIHALKRRSDALALEKVEAHEALHRANTETAELGVSVCVLTGQNEESRLRWEGLQESLRQLEEEAQGEASLLASLRQENGSLQEELSRTDGLPAAMLELRQHLEQAREQARSLQAASQAEIQALRLQLSSEGARHQNQVQGLEEGMVSVKSQLEAALENVSTLETKLTELEVANRGYSQMIVEKTAQISCSESLILQKEEQLNRLKGDLSRAEEDLALAQKACQDLSETLHRATVEKQSCDLKTSAEIDDLYRTKRNLEERLIELIRDKDQLWQKSDALEFEQKLRAEEQTDRDVNHCLGCRSQFSWWLRRHNCRLCGRPFCYYCCSNTVSTQQGSGRERCCKDCYAQHSAVVERHPQEEPGSPPRSHTPFSPLPTPTKAMPSVTVAGSSKPEDGAFDIITDEEVNCVYDSDSLSYTTALTPESGHQGAEDLSSSTSAGDTTAEDSEELMASAQDAEICLLKSGELTLSVPFGVDDICHFGEESRELFIKSSCYSVIPITVGKPGPTISWVFSSEPKRISFSMVYRENTETPLEQAKVLIPLTRFNSHKETIQGQLKVRNPGEYTLIFDNSFSRFISKKVLYQLTVEMPVIYDGSDCP